MRTLTFVIIGGLIGIVLCALASAQETEALRINLDVKNMSITDVL